MKIFIAFLWITLICSLIISACNAGDNDCNQDVVIAALDQLDLSLAKFNERVEIISNTERSALPPQISELESVLQEVQDSEVPSCIQLVQDTLSQYMFTMIEGLQLYALDNPENEVIDKIEQATDLMGDYIIASLEARVGTPSPQP